MLMDPRNKVVKTILFHISAWMLLFSLPLLLNLAFDPTPEVPSHKPSMLPIIAISYLLMLIFFYFNAQVVVPTLMYKRRIGLFVASQFALIFLYIFLKAVAFTSLYNPERFNISFNILYNLFPILFILASSVAYRMIKDRMEADTMAQARERENLKTELSLLRSQVSPHFMFNVLNNMVALARKRSDLLEPSLIKLSSLMRYMLYETDEKRVAIEREVEYLQSYIDLQQQRFGNTVEVKCHFELEDPSLEIEPMLLIPFVENAFKHGVGMIDNPKIIIDLKTINHTLHFQVTNTFNPASKELKDETSGIGLTNVKRRLDLLYPKHHSLDIHQKDHTFDVHLKLDLHS
jgi:sensor histidine kinase YesM